MQACAVYTQVRKLLSACVSQYSTETSLACVPELGVKSSCHYHEFASSSSEAASSAASSVTSGSTTSSPGDGPLFSPAQQQWIQQMIAAQSARRSEVSETGTSSSGSLTPATSSQSTTSTIGNIGEPAASCIMLNFL